MWKAIAAIAMASLFVVTPAVAQQKDKAAKPRSAASIECSKQADAKGLHGKARKTFRSKCMRQMKRQARAKA